MIKKFFAAIFAAALILIAVPCLAAKPELYYQAHIQDRGWLKAVKNGGIAGTTGKALRFEGIVINLNDLGRSMVKYSAHVQNIGWQTWQESGGLAGTTGKALRMEAIKIKLNKPYDEKYDIFYRVYVENGGWLGFAKNGEPAGTTGAALRMEALQIFLVTKGKTVKSSGGKKPFYERQIKAGTVI